MADALMPDDGILNSPQDAKKIGLFSRDWQARNAPSAKDPPCALTVTDRETGIRRA